MGFTAWANGRVRRLDWLDIGCIKLAAMGFALAAAASFEPLRRVGWRWWALLSLMAALRPGWRAYAPRRARGADPTTG